MTKIITEHSGIIPQSFKVLFVIMIVIFISSCSQNKPKKVYLEWGCRLTIPTPSILEESFTAHHSISFDAKEKNYQIQAQIEYENQSLTIVGLSTSFATMFTLNQIENKIDYENHFKIPVRPKLILGFFYVIFAPLEKLKTQFSGKIFFSETNSEKGRLRRVDLNGKQLFNIEYIPFKNGTKIIFSHLKRNLSFTLIEDYREKL